MSGFGRVLLAQQRQALIHFSSVKAELWNELSQKHHCDALQRPPPRCFSHAKWGNAETTFFSLNSALEARGHPNHKYNQELCCTHDMCFLFVCSQPSHVAILTPSGNQICHGSALAQGDITSLPRKRHLSGLNNGNIPDTLRNTKKT